MSHTLVSIHARGVARSAVVAVVEKAMAKRGLERMDAPSGHEPMLTRARIVEGRGWVSIAIEELDSPEAWAKTLARALGAPVVGAWFWDGEATLVVTLFDGKSTVGELSLPKDARRAPDGRVAVPLGRLSRLVASKTPKRDGLELLVRADDASFDDDGRCEYLPEEVSHRTIERAFGIPALFLDPLDEDAPEEGVSFRPKASSAQAKRFEAERAAEAAERRADYDGRIYGVGWLAFEMTPTEIADVVDATARVVVDALSPHLGKHALEARAIVPTKSERMLPAPSEKSAWKKYVAAIHDGAMIDLSRRGAPVIATAWLVLRDGALLVGWCMRGSKDHAKREQLARVMAAVFDASANDERCFGAVLACQRPPLSLQQQVLAYEYLRGFDRVALQPSTHRGRARAPGWRVLVPKRAPRLAKEPPAGIVSRKAKAGTVLEANAADPHAVESSVMDAMEAYLGLRA